MKTIKEEAQKLMKQNLFGKEDLKLAEFLLTLFFKEIKESYKDAEHSKWLKNLKDSNSIEQNKIVVSEDFEEYSGIEFCLLMNCAKGYLTRSTSITRKRRKKR